MEQVLLSAMAIVATMFGAGMIIPQIVRLRRTANVEGLSIVWIGVGVGLNSWWVAYAVGAGVWGVLPVSVISVALYLFLAAQVFRIDGSNHLRQFVAGAVALGLAPVPALIFGGLQAAGIVVGLSYAIQFAPAVVESFRSADLGGVSPTTWLLAFGEALIWSAYGLAVLDVALVIGGVGGAVASAAILFRLFRVLRPRIVLTGVSVR